MVILLPFIHRFFCPFKVNLCHSFLMNCASWNLQTLLYTRRMIDCIVGLRLGLIAYVRLFLLKLESRNLVCIWIMSC